MIDTSAWVDGLPPDFNWKDPDYTPTWLDRARRLAWVRGQDVAAKEERAKVAADRQAALKLYYRDHPDQFICDWGVTLDPKQVEKGKPSRIPFILFPKQREWVHFVIRKWRAGEPFLTEKTRQMGFSWLAMALACTLCLHHDGMAIGFGSRKEEYVDNSKDSKSLFYKGREFMDGLPQEFRGGWVRKKHATHMQLSFPETGASIIGEAGDNIGRGATTSIYIVDEAAFLERPLLTDASLSQTTNCRGDISTPNGMANPFYEKRTGGKIEVFTFHWRDDPRKDDAWYAKQVRDLDALIVAQEIDIDYAASVEGVLIPSAWVQSSINARARLGIAPSGRKMASFDVADEGSDKCAFIGATGNHIEHAEEWSGEGSDVFASVERVFRLCDQWGYDTVKYDADGMGADVRGNARVINARRKEAGERQILFIPFRGSEGVYKPEGKDEPPRQNKDMFKNQKAQSWWRTRRGFMMAHRAIQSLAMTPEELADMPPWDPDEIISISPTIAHRDKITRELSQPTRIYDTAGKMLINKMPDGVKSPNLADAVMINRSRTAREPMQINEGALAKV